MRIRKNSDCSSQISNLSGFTGAVCQLNQNPWDVGILPPEQQTNEEGTFVVNEDSRTRGEGNPSTPLETIQEIQNDNTKQEKQETQKEGKRNPPRGTKRSLPNSIKDDMYFYTGFGPRWRRRRGSNKESDADQPALPSTSPVPTNVEDVDEDTKVSD